MKKATLIFGLITVLAMGACSSNAAPQTEKQQDSVDKVMEQKNEDDVEAKIRADEEKEARMQDSIKKAQEGVK